MSLSVIAGIVLVLVFYQYFKESKTEPFYIKTENEWVQKIESDIELQNQYDLMHLYTADIDTYESKVFMKVAIPKNATKEEKFKWIMEKLGHYHFNIPIEEITFSIRDGKMLASVNLKEHSRNQSTMDVRKFEGENWAGQYFQGSAGSTITSSALVETALQEAFLGEWVDGVEFLYNGKPIEFDHMLGISEIKWRK